MELLNEIASWAWARHHNPWSWYIRPLFLLPYVAFAWRRSAGGIVATLLALATSMAWFPAPEHADPRVEAFLAMEREFLLGPPTPGKIAGLVAAPAAMAALALAFWRRSIAWGVTTLVAIALSKVAWSVAQAGPAGWSVAAPASIGLGACVVAVLAFQRLRSRRLATTFRLRDFRRGDEPALREVFHSSVHGLAREHYTQEQLDAWAPKVHDPDEWAQRMRTIRPYVVEVGGRTAGYADLQETGYVDHFFVAAEFAGRGVGTALMQHIVRTAAERRIAMVFANVSLAAEGFFARHGFSVASRRSVEVRGVVLSNARMTRMI